VVKQILYGFLYLNVLFAILKIKLRFGLIRIHTGTEIVCGQKNQMTCGVLKFESHYKAMQFFDKERV